MKLQDKPFKVVRLEGFDTVDLFPLPHPRSFFFPVLGPLNEVFP